VDTSQQINTVLLLLLLPLLPQVLFIDRHDQLRARLAAGMFEKVCACVACDKQEGVLLEPLRQQMMRLAAC
jgi:hypothetical protein